MQVIKNIIFDLGGVILNLDYSKTENAFKQSGIDHFSTLFKQDYSSPVFEDLEKGNILPDDFYNEFRKETNTTLSNEEIKNAWNALLLSFPKERLEFLNEIKNKYNIFLFSNTNQIHHDAFMEIYERETGRNDFNQHFIKAYYSHEMGMRKPDAESYLFILNEQKLEAAETLFIDDTLKNIEAAQKLGLQTIHLTKPTTILDLNL